MPEEPRLEALARAGVDFTVPEAEFDRLTRLAVASTAATAAALTFVGEHSVFVKSVAGRGGAWMTDRVLAPSACISPFVVRSRVPLIVPEMATHPLTEGGNHPCWQGGALAAVPVRDAQGQVLGALGVVDGKVREWSDEDVRNLADVAALVARELEFRATPPRGEASDGSHPAKREASNDVLCVMDEQMRIQEVGARAVEVWGHSPDELIGRRIADLFSDSDAAAIAQALGEVAAGAESKDFTSTYVNADGSRRVIYWTALWSEEDGKFYAITRKEAPAPTQVKNGDKRVLVVDDYREIGLLVRTALASAGISKVDVAWHAERALQMLEQRSYDLVISDLRMEPTNGVELYTMARTRSLRKNVPFLIISGYANLEVLQHMKKLGIGSFVAKPFRTVDLVKHVQRILDGSANRAAA